MPQEAGEPQPKPEPLVLANERFELYRVAKSDELASVDFVVHSIAFWTARVHALDCPECGVTGTLSITDRCYCIQVYCMRGNCAYDVEVVFNRKK